MEANDQTLIPIEEFAKLKQTDMVLKLRDVDAEVARGKSRATKQTLIDLYTVVVKQRTGVPAGEMMTVDMPNVVDYVLVSSTGHVESGAVPDTDELVEQVRELKGTEEITNLNGDSYPRPEMLKLRVVAEGEIKELEIDPSTLNPGARQDLESLIALTGIYTDEELLALTDSPRELPTGESLQRLVEGVQEALTTRASAAEVICPVVEELTPEAVARVIRKLPQDKIRLLTRYRDIAGGGNRRTTRVRDALIRKIRRFLPVGVDIKAALSVI